METVVKVINYTTIKHKEMDTYIEKRIKFWRKLGETTKDAALTLLEETKRAMFIWMPGY